MVSATAREHDDSPVPPVEASPPVEARSWMDLAVAFIHGSYRKRLRIAEVAAAAGVHPSYLAATFRQDRGVPLGAYIRELRIEWVAEQLAQTDHSISRLAVRAGFADQSHLTRAFKSATGLTPAKYRGFHCAGK